MNFSSTPSAPLRAQACVLIGFLFLAGGLTSGCQPRGKSDLEPGKTIDRELGGTESHFYHLSLNDDDYISLRIWQPSLDVKAKLVGPNGEVIPVFDDPGALEEPDRLVAVVNKGGSYRLVVEPKDSSRRGRYRLALRDLRGPRFGDGDLLAADRGYQEARRFLWAAKPGEPLQPALDRFRKSLELWKQRGDAAGQVDASIQIANNFGDPALTQAEALQLSQDAVRLAKEVGYLEGEARALNAVGNAFDRGGSRRSDAIAAFEGAAQLSRALRDDHQLGISLYSLGWDQYYEAQFPKSLQALEEARRILSRVGNVGMAAKAVIAISSVQEDLGETTKALTSCEAAGRLSKSLPVPDPSLDANVAYCLGTIHRKRGEWEAARQEFEESLRINIQLNQLKNVPSIRQALGSIYFNLGDPKTALAEYSQGFDLLVARGERKDLQGRLLTNTGWMYQAMGDPKRALSYYERALPLNIEAKYDSGLASTRHNIGVAYMSLKRPQEGLRFLQQALDFRRRGGERAAEATTLLEIGSLYQALGKAKQAAGFYQRALDGASKIESTGLQAECLFRWARLENEEGQLGTALDKVKKSLQIVESARSSVLSDKLKTSFFASKRAYYELYMDILMRLEAQSPGEYQAAALEGSERARSRGLLDLLAEGRIKVQQGIAPELKQREVELMGRLSELRDKLGKTPDTEAAAVLERQLDEAQAAMEGLESRIRAEHGKYAEVRYPTPLRLQQIQQLLDDRTALLQYFTGEDGSYLFVVTRRELKSFRLRPRDEIATQVKAIWRVLQQPGIRQLGGYQTLASRLFLELVGPAEGVLRDKDRLLIAPDGPLYLLPFEALLTDAEGPRKSYRDLPYLLRRFAVSYTPSASVLHGLRTSKASVPRPANAKRFVAFADPNLTAGARGEGDLSRGAASAPLGRLIESSAEIHKIASLYPPGEAALYTGDQATEDNVKTNPWLRTAHQIDFATHGTVNETRPELSSLELTRTKEDGRLTVYEIFNLQLSADLVTLSACDTGLGQEVSGEGIVGMLRAFFYAGARSLVVSLWPVSDRSTSDLMFELYRFRASMEKAEALRRAKLAMIQGDKYAAPYYWAPFILSGEPR